MTTLGKRFPPQAVDIVGQRFGSLVVLERAGMTPSKNATWLCRCDCGETTVAMGKRLRKGETQSCGCRMREGGGARRRPVVDYPAAHRRLQRDLGKATEHRCADCGGPAAEWSYIGGAPDEARGGPQNCPYSHDSAYYQPRCHSCHRRRDYKPPTVA